MKNRNTIVAVLFGAVVLFAVTSWAWDPLDRWWTVRAAINQIISGNEVPQNQTKLADLDDRAYVIGRLEEALERKTSVAGKLRVIRALQRFKEDRIISRAFHSDVLSTRRAVLAYNPNSTDNREEKIKVLVDWIEDDQADMRARAMSLVGILKIEEAVPVLLKFIDKPSQPGADLTRNALKVLGRMKPKGLFDRLLAIANDKNRDGIGRGLALEAAATQPDAPTDRSRAAALAILRDTSLAKDPRLIAAGILRYPRLTSPETLDALEKVLLDPKDPHPLVQKSCFVALGNTAPLDRVRGLVLDKRVYNHENFALRIYVTTTLASLRVKERLALEILCEYLIDSDKADPRRKLRWEAMLSLFTMTGAANGVAEKQFFRKPPAEIMDKEIARRYFFSTEHTRPGISPQQLDAVKSLVADDEKMANIRQTYLSNIDAYLDAWRKQAEAEAAKKKAAEEKAKKAAEGDKDPKATPDKDSKKEENASDPKTPKDGG